MVYDATAVSVTSPDNLNVLIPDVSIPRRDIIDIYKEIVTNRRLAIAMGYDPDTKEVLSLTQHHTKLVMMSATKDEYRYYYERLRQ